MLSLRSALSRLLARWCRPIPRRYLCDDDIDLTCAVTIGGDE
jgi:hypothetical protein